MINHARTLLLNRPADYFEGIPYSEYAPPSFTPVALSTDLRRIHEILIPKGLDKTGENYTAAAIMRVLHAPEIVPYLELLDNRFTYLDSVEALVRTTDDPVDIDVAQSTDCDCTPHYSVDGRNYPDAIVLSGQHQWTLSPTDSDRIQVAYTRGSEEILFVTNGTTKTTPIELLPGYLSVYLDVPTTRLTGSFRYIVTTNLAVPYNIGERQTELDQYLARPGAEENLFDDVAGFESTMTELRDTWRNSTEVTLRYSVAAVAWIYQIEGLRQNG
jgi:hypothetical protein